MNVFSIKREIRRLFSVLVLSSWGVFLFAGIALADCTASFSWLPNTESNIVGYKIYYGQTDGGPYPNVVNVGNPAPVNGRVKWTVSDLVCDQQYYFVCMAVNDVNVPSSYSTQVSVIPNAENEVDISLVPGVEIIK